MNKHPLIFEVFLLPPESTTFIRHHTRSHKPLQLEMSQMVFFHLLEKVVSLLYNPTKTVFAIPAAERCDMTFETLEVFR